MKQRLIALALCLVMGLGLAAPSFAVQADVPGGLDGSEPDLWDILAPDAPGGLEGDAAAPLPAPDEPAQLDTPAQNAPAEGPDLTQIGENAPAASCLYCGAAGDVHADFCPLYVPAEPSEGPGSAEDAPVPPASTRPAEPSVSLEAMLEQTPLQAVRTLSAEQPGVLTDDQRFLAFSTFQRPRFAESKGTDGETPERVDNPGVETKKEVTVNTDGTYTVSIESYVTGRTITTETAAPVDIILVLDMSGQMKKADLIAMKTAANEFIRMASSEKGERRIALVTYQNNSGTVISGDGDADESALVNVTKGANGGAQALTGAVDALSESDLKGDAYCQYGLARATQIFQSYEKPNVPRYVLLLSAGVFGKNGQKMTGETSECAAQVAINVSTILKTARGETPDVKWAECFYNNIAMDKQATKDNLGSDHVISFDKGCGAVVYCVGLNMPIQKKDGEPFDELEYSYGDIVDDADNMAGYGNTAARINEAMYRICSDRPDSSHVTPDSINENNSWEKKAFPTTYNTAKYYKHVWDSLNWRYVWKVADTRPNRRNKVYWSGTYPDWATRNMPGGHFLTGDTGTIEKCFATIFENIQSSNPAPSVTLDKKTVLIDVVMPYFEVPEGTSDIKAKVVNVADNTVDDTLSQGLHVDCTVDHVKGTSSVSVKGFDYSKYFVNEKDKTGKKLVLTFTIQPIQGFMGGNGVPTNNVTKSGVFAKEGELVENLPDPGTKDVPLAKIDLTVPDKSIYLSQTLTEAKLLKGAVVTLKGDNKPLPLTEEVQKDDWRFDFVTLTLAATEPDTWETCAEFDATATLTAKDNENTKSIATAEPTVHVFRPTVHVTANDVWADYGVNIDLAQNCVTQGETTWAHSCTGENVGNPSGTAPAISDLAYTFGLGAGGTYTTTEDDAKGTVTALTYKVGGKDYTDLAWEAKYPENGDHFTIHINHFDLNVSKTWGGADCYKQSAIFNLSTENGQAMATQFTLSPETGKSSTTVHGLVCGKTYALSEDMTWSWRYRSASTGSVTPGEHAVISKTAPTIDPAQMSFTNTLKNSFWFDAASFVSNLFKGKGA